jgi:hypothetical protein
MKITLPLLCLIFILSCGQDNATEKTSENTTEQAPAASTEPQSLPPLTYPALYSNWEIGKRENINTVLSLYKHGMNHQLTISEIYLRIALFWTCQLAKE